MHTCLQLRSASVGTRTDTARQGEQCPSSCPRLTLTGELHTREGPYCTIPANLFSSAFCIFLHCFARDTRTGSSIEKKLSGACFPIWRLAAKKHLERCSMAGATGMCPVSEEEGGQHGKGHLTLETCTTKCCPLRSAPFLIRPTHHLCSRNSQKLAIFVPRNEETHPHSCPAYRRSSRGNHHSLTGRQRLRRPGRCDQGPVQLARSSQRPRVQGTANPSTKVQK